MVRTTFISLAVLVAHGALAVTAICEADKVRCEDPSQCIWARWRCDGQADCNDGSDESELLCDRFPTVDLPLDSTVKTRIEYKYEHYSIDLHLCGEKHCSRVQLDGVRADGTMRYSAYTGCNLLGKGTCSSYRFNSGSFDPFTPGEVVLMVQHRPNMLAVWMEGHPDDAVKVPVDLEGAYANLRVRPLNWATDMPVEFTDSSEEPTSTVTEAVTTEEPGSTQTATTEEPGTTQAATTEEEPGTTQAAATTTTLEPSPCSTSSSWPASTAVPTSAPWPPVPAPVTCSPDISFLLIPVHGACNKYVICYSGRSRVMGCPSGLVFNYQVQTCDWPVNVACSP